MQKTYHQDTDMVNHIIFSMTMLKTSQEVLRISPGQVTSLYLLWLEVHCSNLEVRLNSMICFNYQAICVDNYYLPTVAVIFT